MVGITRSKVIGFWILACERHGGPNTTTHCRPNRCAARTLRSFRVRLVPFPGINWRGKRVVIAGMGAFAVENVHGAQINDQKPDTF